MAFATPFGTDKAFDNRKSTVDRWVGDGTVWERVVDENGVPVLDTNGYGVHEKHVIGVQEPTIIDNVFLEGFELDKSVSRSVTDNKWFRITDPRGFQLEISASNLTDILHHGTIDHGRIAGKFIWGRNKQVMYLTRPDHPEYINLVNPITRTDLQPGDIVRFGKAKVRYIFYGVKYAHAFGIRYRRTTSSFPYTRPTNADTMYSKRTDPIYIFKLADAEDYSSNYIHAVTKLEKFTIIEEGRDLDAIDWSRPIQSRIHTSLDWAWLFSSKDEQDAFVVSEEEIRAAIAVRYPNITLEDHFVI